MTETTRLGRWQYLTVTVDYTTFRAQVNGHVQPVGDVPEFLDSFGRDGWELVSVVQNSVQPNLWGFFFKRPL